MANPLDVVDLMNKNTKLVSALKDIAARARFELDHPTEMRDTAFSLIEKTAISALKETK